MYLMVEFRCVKYDKEYGIVYYEKVFSLFMVSEVERGGETLKKITVVPAGMNYSATGGQVADSCQQQLFIYLYIQIKSFS